MHFGKSDKKSPSLDFDLEAQQSEDLFQIPKFTIQCNELKENNKNIKLKCSSLQNIHAQILESVTTEDKANLRKQADRLSDEITEIAQNNRILLKNISMTNKTISSQVNTGSAEWRVKDLNFKAISKEFIDALNETQAGQETFKNKSQLQLKRQYKVVNPNATEGELSRLVESSGGDMMSDQVFALADRRTDAKRALEEMQERHQEIMNIEKSVLELQQLFTEISQLVEQQGDMVDRIDKSVESAQDHTEKALVEMTKGQASQKSLGKRKMILLMIILLLVAAGAVALYFGLFRKRTS